jgi:hypothetical protein
MAQITYADKVQGQTSAFPTNQKWAFGDANEVKSVVNANDTLRATNTSNIATNTADIATNTADIAALQAAVAVRNFVNTSSSISASFDDYVIVDASGGDVTITLEAIAATTGRIIDVRKGDSSTNKVVIDGNGGETINGQQTIEITNQYDSVTCYTNFTEWIIN